MIAGLVTSVETVCGLVSALFQYFMLVFFGWTAVEAVFLFHGLIIVIPKLTGAYVLKSALIVWCKYRGPCVREHSIIFFNFQEVCTL